MAATISLVDDDGYGRKRDESARRSREQSEHGRDIGDIPEVVNPERRAAAKEDLAIFAKTYFPEKFPLPWGRDHPKVIRGIEEVSKDGGKQAIAMPRGSGKTSLCETAVLWASLNGVHPFTKLIGPTEHHAAKILESILAELTSNPLLLEDFPEVCYPFWMLEGNTRRCQGQLHDGNPTNIAIKKDRIILPTIDGSRSSEFVIDIAGLTGSNVRGSKYVRRLDGRTVRPSLVLIDDPQTDKTAKSEVECENRIKLINGAVVGMAGPGEPIGILAAVTVIREGDVADTLLDRYTSPTWRGLKCRLMDSMPNDDAMKLWREYWSMLCDDNIRGHGSMRATEYYRQNREAMDAGAIPTWEQRHEPQHLSAVQFAMDKYFTDPFSFSAEMQQDPISPDASSKELTVQHVLQRVSPQWERGIVPSWATRITAFIDVHKEVLFYAIVAWSEKFDGHVIDYGTYPKQLGRQYYVLHDCQYTLEGTYPDISEEARIREGLEVLVKAMFQAQWPREDNADIKCSLDYLLVDSGYLPDIVYQIQKDLKLGSRMRPSKGRAVKATSVPWDQIAFGEGERLGFNWIEKIVQGRTQYSVQFNANFWKTFLCERFQQPLGDHGRLTLFNGIDHRLLADHCVAERSTLVEANGRQVEEWAQRTEKRKDNHWFDCLVGCCVGASIQGIKLLAIPKLRKKQTQPQFQGGTPWDMNS